MEIKSVTCRQINVLCRYCMNVFTKKMSICVDIYCECVQRGQDKHLYVIIIDYELFLMVIIREEIKMNLEGM